MLLNTFNNSEHCQLYCIFLLVAENLWKNETKNEMAYSTTANNLYTGTDQVRDWQ